MPALTELPEDALRVAYEVAGVLIRFRDYLPPGGLLVMLAGKFRDDVGDALELEPGEPAYRGRERRSLDELTSVELDSLDGAVGLLLSRFTACMDDPELAPLLRELRGLLADQKAERAQIRAGIRAS
jgi:hypothetical protein